MASAPNPNDNMRFRWTKGDGSIGRPEDDTRRSVKRCINGYGADIPTNADLAAGTTYLVIEEPDDHSWANFEASEHVQGRFAAPSASISTDADDGSKQGEQGGLMVTFVRRVGQERQLYIDRMSAAGLSWCLGKMAEGPGVLESSLNGTVWPGFGYTDAAGTPNSKITQIFSNPIPDDTSVRTRSQQFFGSYPDVNQRFSPAPRFFA